MGRYDFDEDEQPSVVIEKQQGSVGSFLLGAALGAGIALLFAPQSGNEVRQGLSRRARQARERAEGLVDDATGRVTDTFYEARAQVEGRIDHARQALDLKRQQVVRAMDAGRAAAQQAREDLERRIAVTKAAYEAGMDVAHEGRTSTTTTGAGSGASTASTTSTGARRTGGVSSGGGAGAGSEPTGA
jgi:gas vesicle protein